MQCKNEIPFKSRHEFGKVLIFKFRHANGMIIKRVDVTGADHGGVPTPHVIEYPRNTLPNGTVVVQTKGLPNPRPATPSEIP